ncbi:hypothetical protein [Chthonomonas calidirosea]|uniref:hypothetical protein n=1 Tax=Chthonomonas calidirosea TaxID=454171 RepID=UPI0006EC9AA9|nr:hypothetical protein [Chthonomonas calidirosea]CEK19489.1 hypothetical protein CP488_02539 [Chthonomonas calidirosea]
MKTFVRLVGRCALLGASLSMSHLAFARNDTLHFLNANGSNSVDVTYVLSGQSHTESTTAGQYNFQINGSQQIYTGFCTDLFDSIFNNDTWSALRTTVSDSTHGLASVYYANGTNGNTISTQNIHAIDYIVAHYANMPASSTKTDAQLAIWDLSLGGSVSYNPSKHTYSWSSIFSAVDSGQHSYGDLAGVYNIEQTAFANDWRSWNSIFENAGAQANGRKQDIAFAATPEASSFISFASLVAGSIWIPLRARRHRRGR